MATESGSRQLSATALDELLVDEVDPAVYEIDPLVHPVDAPAQLGMRGVVARLVVRLRPVFSRLPVTFGVSNRLYQ